MDSATSDVPWFSQTVYLTLVLLILVTLLYQYWSALYIRCVVRLMYRWRRRKSCLPDGPVSDFLLNNQTGGYDEVNFLCVNGEDDSYLHVEITRKPDRKCYTKLTLCVKGHYIYTLPTDVVTYNNSRNSFRSSGLTLSILEDGTRLKLLYSGPLSQSKKCENSGKDITNDNDTVIKQVKILLLWKNLSANLSSDDNFTQRSLVQYLSKLYAERKVTAGEILELATNTDCVSGQSTVQSGLMHGVIQVSGEEEQELLLRGFKRRSVGEIRDWDNSSSYVEQVLVSKNGNFHYNRLSVPSARGLTATELSRFHSIRMHPNGELDSADLDFVYSFLAGWRLSETVSVLDRKGCQSSLSTADSFHQYTLGDGESGDRHCVLLPLSLQHRHCGLSSPDTGAGLLLYSNVRAQEVSSGVYTVDCVPSKEVIRCHPSKSYPLLKTLSMPVGEVSADDKLVVGLDHPDCRNDKLVGGKGSQLAVLYQSDIIKQCQVPMAACLTVQAFYLQLQTNRSLTELSAQLSQAVDAETENIQKLCDTLKSEFLLSEINPKISKALQLHLQHIEHFDEETRVAVRSSAIGEDGEELSAAGQMDTILGVKGYNEIFAAVKKCWSSHFTFSAVQYKRQHGQPINTGMGVVIQKMVHADVAGALFTNDPVTASCNTMVINANFGVGESVVSGEAEPDTFRVTYTSDQGGSDIFSIEERVCGSKQVQYVVSESGTVGKQSVSGSSVFCADDETVLALCQIGLELERRFGHPCDIEWAICQGQIYLLQSRPITTLTQETEYELLHEFDSALAMDQELLSTMNIGEAFPGALCPLTISVVVKQIEDSMVNWSVANGLNVVPNLFRLHKVYCNHAFLNVHAYELSNKYRSSLADRRMMELALAGHVIDSMTDEVIRAYHPARPLLTRLYCSWRFFSMILGKREKCLVHEQALDKLTVPLTTSCAELLEYVNHTVDISSQVVKDYMPATAISPVYSQVLMGILTKGKHVWEAKHYTDLASLLACHINEVFSAGVPNKLEELSRLIHSHPAFAAHFLEISIESGDSFLNSKKTPAGVREAYQLFMEKFGHRGLCELDLLKKCWSQDPSQLIETLQMMVKSIATGHNVDARCYSVQEVVDGLQCDLTKGQKLFIKFILPKVKKAVNSREEVKSILVKAASKMKLGFWRLSELMYNQGYLPSPELLFFLTVTEIKDVLSNRNGSLVNRAKRRRKIYEKQNSMQFPRFNHGYPEAVVTHQDLKSLEVETELKGMPVSVGEVTGTARVVKNLSEAHTIQKNDILIVYFTDVGWAPYFPMISGVVTEQGGLVSHGAVVAREYGIPCVVSCHNATQVFQSGDTICLNGSTGVVRRLKRDNDL